MNKKTISAILVAFMLASFISFLPTYRASADEGGEGQGQRVRLQTQNVLAQSSNSNEDNNENEDNNGNRVIASMQSSLSINQGGNVQISGGRLQSVSGTMLGVNVFGITLNVDAASASFQNRSNATVALSNLQVGDMLLVRGTINASNGTIVARSVVDVTLANQENLDALRLRVQQLFALLAQLEQQLQLTLGGGTVTSAPVISAVNVSNVSSASATITWTTNVPTNSKVLYSTISPVSAATASIVSDGSLALNHSITVQGLSPSTTYFFMVQSVDAFNNNAVSAQSTFVTAAAQSTGAPVISAVGASSLAPTSADITWHTNVNATSKVFFSTTSPVNIATASTASDATQVSDHSIVVTGLTANTTYFFEVQSMDASGNVGTSAQFSFMTPTTQSGNGPVISAVTVSNIISTGATITWSTDEAATSKVFYSTTFPVNVATASSTSDATLMTSHSLSLTGLTANTTYFFEVRSADALGNFGTSAQFALTTSASPTLPVISGVNAMGISSSTAIVTWSTNVLASSKVFYSTVSPVNLATASSTSDSSLAINHSLELTGLNASTTYFYVAQSTDGFGNVATSTQSSFVTGH